MSSAIDRYLDAYERYQTLFAAARLTGWDGNVETAPGALFLAHQRMIDELGEVYRSAGRTKPNYIERAREKYCGCTENGVIVLRSQCGIHGPSKG